MSVSPSFNNPIYICKLGDPICFSSCISSWDDEFCKLAPCCVRSTSFIDPEFTSCKFQILRFLPSPLLYLSLELVPGARWGISYAPRLPSVYFTVHPKRSWDLSLFLFFSIFSFHFFGMVEIVDWPFKNNCPKYESNSDRKEAENTVLRLSNGPSRSPFFEAEKHLPRPLVPGHQEPCVYFLNDGLLRHLISWLFLGHVVTRDLAVSLHGKSSSSLFFS